MQPEVVLRIDALDNTRAAMQSVKGKLDGLQQQTKGFQDRVRDLQPTFRRMAGFGTAAFAGISLSVGKAVQEAGNAEKIAQNFETTFGDSTDTISSFISNFSNEFAFVESEMMQGANSIGFQLNAMGDVGKEAGEEITTSLLTASGGLSDFFGGQMNVSQAADAMAKALGGQSQQLTNMGFNVLEGDIKEMAESMGINTDEMTRAERAMALTQLVMDQTKGSVAGLEEGMDSYTGQQRALRKAKLETAQTFGEVFLPLATDLLETIRPIITSIGEWISENEDLTKKIIIGAGALAGIVAVVGTLGMVLSPLIAAFKVAPIVIAAIASPIGIIIALIAVIAATIAYLALNWEEHWDNIKWAFGVAVDWIVDKWTSIKNGFGVVIEWIANKLSSTLEGAKGFVKSFANFFIGIAEGIANAWVRGVNTIIDALNSIQISIPSWVPGLGGKSFGINLPNVPELNIPRLADGGIVTRSTLANIGEAGPEAVIPLDRFGDLGGGDTYHIHISGTFMNDRETARRIGDELIHRLKHQQRLTSA